MTVLEVLCAVWVLACAAGACIASWTAALSVLSQGEEQRVAADCADDAAERWFAGNPIPQTYSVNGQLCTVRVTASDSGRPLVVITAECQNARQTLELSAQ